jgi:stage II sporulation protein R
MFEKRKLDLLRPTKRLKRWEVILLATLAAAMLCGGLLSLRQAQLASRLVRLHVVANSDSDADQTLKLAVRDAVLAQASACLEGVENAEEAVQRLDDSLETLAQAGQVVVEQQGFDYPVTAQLETTHFPTKTYGDFSLPAGEYQALRIVIGSGAGHNWWCVVFPTLCVSASADWQDTAVSGGLTESDVALMEGAEEGYVLRFKCLELWDQLLNFWQGN